MAFYVYCDDNCRYEGMTKEEILTAIEQAIEQGHVSDPDGAVFSRIKEIRAGQCVQLWVGTEAEFNTLDPAPKYGRSTVRVGENGVLYLCSDEALFEQIDKHVADKNNPHGVTFEQVIGAGAVPVKSGGTGSTTTRGAEYNINGGMTESLAAVTDASQIAFKYSSPSASVGVFVYKKAALLWEWIASKIRSTFGFSTGGVLPVKNGGTDSETARGAEYNINGDMPESTHPITAENLFVFRRAAPNATDGVFVYKKASVMWEWIVAVVRETLGVHDVVYSETEPEYVEGRIWLKPVE